MRAAGVGVDGRCTGLLRSRAPGPRPQQHMRHRQINAAAPTLTLSCASTAPSRLSQNDGSSCDGLRGRGGGSDHASPLSSAAAAHGCTACRLARRIAQCCRSCWRALSPGQRLLVLAESAGSGQRACAATPDGMAAMQKECG